MRPLTQVMAVLGAGLLFEAFLRAHREIRDARLLTLRFVPFGEHGAAEQREAAQVAKPS